MTRRGRFKDLPAKICLSILSTLMTLGILEFAVRTYRTHTTGEVDAVGLPAEKNGGDARELLAELSGGEKITGETFNIYYFGGSTTASGHFVSLIERMLGSEVQGKPVRSIIVAADGQDLHYNYVRLKTILDGKRKFRPDVCVIYSGHNEYLKFHNPELEGVVFGRLYPGPIGRLASRSYLVRELLGSSYRLEIDEREYFDQPLFHRANYAAVVKTYQQQLETMAGWLAQHKIPVVISTVAGNYADWEPNRSIFCENNPERRSFLRLMQEGDALERRGDPQRAVESYEKAIEICPRFAEAQFRLGQVHAALGHADDARKAFFEAVSHDGMPLRAMPTQNDFIRRLGASGRAHVVDAVKALHGESADGLVGFNLMVDGHHPNELGYGVIAELIAREIAGIFSVPEERLDLPDDDGIVAHFEWSEPRKAFRQSVGRGRWFSRLATWRHDPAARLDKAEEHFLRAREIARSRYEPHLGLAVVHYLRKDTTTANEHLAAATERNADAVSDYVKRPWVASVIRRAGEAP